MLKTAIKRLMQGKHLDHTLMTSAMDDMLNQKNEAQTAAFLALLHHKGETGEELFSLVTHLRERMIPINTPFSTLDIVGTGGDGFNTVNISTGSALLAASCGVKIAKHGNRSVSSLAGSADVIEALGINFDVSAEQIIQSINKTNFAFIYAPLFHPALAAVKPVRQNLGIRTSFNIIGPLLNPTRAKHLMIGVADPIYLHRMADVLLKLQVTHACVFHCAGLDEICSVAPIDMIEIKNNEKRERVLDPAEYGMSYCKIGDLVGGDAKHNAKLLITYLKGKTGPIADSLILNAGMANYIYGLSDSIAAGIERARAAHHDGKGYQVLNQLSEASYA